MWRKLSIFLLFLMLVPGLALATTGKIRGKVVDRETGDPLPGANVQIVGTTLGAATNVDGEYFILNVPAGTYSLRASFIGYRDVTISNVQINVDLTTTVNFEMASEALEVSDIEIIAERPLVNKSATNAVRITSAEQFEKLPVRGTQAVYGLQPGVTIQNNNVYIRGGRSDEVGFLLEGSTTRNIMNGDNTINVIPEALEEAQIQAGGYNAEYGGANSGIISQTLRSGTPDFHARLQAETDQWPGQSLGDRRLDTHTYGYEDFVLTLSGPIYKNRIKFFVAGQRTNMDDSRQVFWSGADIHQGLIDVLRENDPSLSEADARALIVDSGNFGGQPGEALPGTDGDDNYVVTNGNIPDGRSIWNLNGSLNFDYNPVLFRLTMTSSFQEDDGVGARPFLNLAAADRFAETQTSRNLLTGKLTHLLGSNTFYEVSLSYFDFRTKTTDPRFEDNYLLYNDSLAVANEYGDDIARNYRARATDPAAYGIFGFPFQRPGQAFTTFTKQHQNYIAVDLDFTTQYGNHEIKFGGEYERWQVRNMGAGAGSQGNLQLLLTQPDLARAIRNGPDDPLYRDAVLRWRRAANMNAYGYDVFGNEVDDDSELHDGPKNPTNAALYLQDKFELGDLVINAGLRFDYFDMDQSLPLDLSNPSFDADDFSVEQDSLFTPDAKTEISPRLGFAFPVTDRTVFHIQYGRFVQMPQFNNVYSGRGRLALIFGAGNFVNNPQLARELDPIETVQYEIGFNQALTDFAAFDLTAFYRDVKGQLQITKNITDATASAGSFNIFQNQDFATTKGVELSLTFRRTNRVSAFLSYAFSDAQGTGSFPNSSVGAVELDDQIPTVVQPLEFSQKHRGSVSVDYRFGRGDGGAILERSGLNFLFTFNSGHPYTRSTGGIAQQGPDTGGLLNDNDPRGREALENIGGSTTPWVARLDARVDKTVPVGPLDVNFYVYVQNLLNTQNVLNVYQRTGNAFDDGFLSNPDLSGDIVASLGDPYVYLYDIVNLQNRQHWWALNRGGFNEDIFGTPRQIRFGLSLEY